MKVTILASYAYLRDQPDDLIHRLVADPRIEFLVDSGAFTAFNSGKEIVLAEYMAWLHKWKQYLFGYMALDKLQDPVQTDANLAVMLADGLKPIPIHVFGDDEKRMDWLFEQSEWVALGGLRRPHRGAAPNEYVKQKMAWAAGRRVHWLGYTDQSMIKGFRPFTVDCASWTSGRTFGQMTLYDGAGNIQSITFGDYKRASAKDRRKYQQQIAMYGYDPSIFDAETSWKNQNYVNHVQRINARCSEDQCSMLGAVHGRYACAAWHTPVSCHHPGQAGHRRHSRRDRLRRPGWLAESEGHTRDRR